jgi:hypothetical protein
MLVMAIPAVATLAIATWAGAAPLHRLSSEFQNLASLGTPEVTSVAAPLPCGGTPASCGGSSVYTKALKIPFSAVFITFTATGDTHQNSDDLGAALLMSASVTDPTGGFKVCEAPFGDGLSTAGPAGWITLQKLPSGTGGTNCNDGGGGDGDCHDNNLVFSCCVLTTPGGGGADSTINLRLASSNGGVVFYERANIQVDASPNPGGTLCKGAGLPDDYDFDGLPDE